MTQPARPMRLKWGVLLPALSKPNAGCLTLRNLPPFSPVASKLMALLRQENISFRDAADLLKSDAAMTAEVLRLANSPTAGLRFPTTSLLQALSVLGVNRIASLTTTLCVGRLLKPLAKLPLMRRCWRHNLATALIASQSGAEYNVDAEKAYTFGLLAGLGRLALLVSDPQAYSQLAERAESEQIPLEILENRFYGFDHRDAGRWLVTEWKLPSELNDILAGSPVEGPNASLALLIREATTEAIRFGFGILNSQPVEAPNPCLFEIAERVNQIEQELGI